MLRPPKSARSLWRWQLRMLDLQRDIQGEITRLKDLGRSSEPALIERARWLRWNARRLGDAYAWLLLGLERKLIYPLGDNSRVAIPPDDQGSRGAIAVLQRMAADPEWGFPLIHDLADCLRIGDATFIHPTRSPRTVEIKSRLLERRDLGGGEIAERYEVSLLAPAVDAGPAGMPSPIAPSGANSAASSQAKRKPTRVERQLERMSIAVQRQHAEEGTVSEIGGSRSVSLSFEDPSADNWDRVRRATRRARRTGYGCEPIGPHSVCVAFYSPDGFTEESLQAAMSGLTNDLIESGMFSGSRPDWNMLFVNSIPREESVHVQYFLPYFLMPLPRATIVDLLHQRMIMLNLFNPAPVAEALLELGLEVDVRPPSGAGGPIHAKYAFEADDGATYEADLTRSNHYVTEMIQEFRSVGYVVGAFAAIIDSFPTFLQQARSGDS